MKYVTHIFRDRWVFVQWIVGCICIMVWIAHFALLITEKNSICCKIFKVCLTILRHCKVKGETLYPESLKCICIFTDISNFTSLRVFFLHIPKALLKSHCQSCLLQDLPFLVPFLFVIFCIVVGAWSLMLLTTLNFVGVAIERIMAKFFELLL